MSNTAKWWIFFIIEFVLVLILLGITIPIYKENIDTDELKGPISKEIPMILLVLGVIGIYSFKTLKSIKIKTGKFKSELLAIIFSFTARVSLIVMGAYFAQYFVKQFTHLGNLFFLFLLVSLGVMVSLFLFAKDCLLISDNIKKV